MQKTWPFFGADLCKEEADGKRRIRKEGRGASKGSWGTGTGVTSMQPKREGEGGRGKEGGEGLWNWKNIHSVRRRKGGKRLLTTARTSVQQIFLTGRQFFDVLLDQLIRYAKSDKT